MNSQLDVTVVGSCMIDLVSYVDRLPLKGETIHGKKFVTGFGGKGANQCIAAAKLGAKAAMVAKVGGDEYGLKYMNNFKDNNVNYEHVEIDENTSTGMASISVAEDGSNSIVIVSGSNLELNLEDVNNAEDMIASSKLLVCQLEIDKNVAVHALQLAHKHNVRTILNFAPAITTFDPEDFKYVDILCLNETEAETLTSLPIKSIPEAVRMVDHLADLTGACVVLTLGENGVIFKEKGLESKLLPSFKVNAVDTTGAGDVFIGALVAQLAEGSCMEMAVQFANRVASFSVQKPGTQTSFPSKEEVDNLMRL